MKYECPSCFLTWEDEKDPHEKICHPLCSFCSMSHSQKELLNWQIDHLENIPSHRFLHILRHLYRFVELELKLLKEKLYDTNPQSKTNGREG